MSHGNSITTQEFIIRAKKRHGNRFNYSLVEYKNAHTNITIICEIHGEFTQTPNRHLTSNGCKLCSHQKLSKEYCLTTHQFISKANSIHKYNYSYIQSVYINNRTKLVITCNIHGDFEQLPADHLSGQGCPECGKHKSTIKRSSNINKFIEKSNIVHNYKYNYSKSIYTNSKTKLIITCNIHGDFEQTPNIHLQGSGCPLCSYSLGELRIVEILNVLNIKYIPQYRFPNCKYKYTLPFDFYLPLHNICIEFDGVQHFTPTNFNGSTINSIENFQQLQLRDQIKNKYCIDNNIKLLRIPYTQFDNIERILKDEL